MNKFIVAKITIITAVVCLLVAAGVYVVHKVKTAHPEKTYEVAEGKVADLRQLAEICTVDIYSEVPVLDTVNQKVLFGIQKQRGSVSFDLEKLQVNADGDTVRVVLSPEIVELYESTDSNSWEVVDTKSLKLLGNGRLTAEEDNLVKSHIRAKSIGELYRNGTIRRARAEACTNLQSLYSRIYRKPVVVTDPTPGGTRATAIHR